MRNFKEFRILGNSNDSIKMLYLSIFLFGWSNKRFHCHHFWATFVNFNFFGPNLKIEISDQFVNYKILRGQIIIFEKIEGSIYNF